MQCPNDAQLQHIMQGFGAHESLVLFAFLLSMVTNIVLGCL